MHLSNTGFLRMIICLTLVSLSSALYAQQVTGLWKGRIDRRKVEVKIIQKGDSLTGTSYYFESANNYRRYSIKGYFDPQDNSVVWWDDQLIEERGGNSSRNPLLSVADFNCPGGGVMKLDGKASPKNDRDHPDGPVNLTKSAGPSFPDEWDFVIDNYTVGANDPYIIDSVGLIASAPVRKPQTVEKPKEIVQPKPVATKKETVPPKPEPPAIVKTEPKPLTVEEKLVSRKRVFMKEIPVNGDSIELRFYDNAEVDGDSISLFLNDQMLFTHVRLSDKAFTIKISVKDLGESNELVMVAENLGSIPPNTSYMVAIVGDKRYDAQLASTENSSAMIRLAKR
jgi:hypothetical protein